MIVRAAVAILMVLISLPCASAAQGEIEATGPQGPLRGLIMRAERSPAPLALIIPGSGPTDRDGNNPLGVRASQYRLLAEALAAAGVSSVRIDKRGMYSSAAATPDANAVTIADYVDDVAAWIASIRAKTAASCVWLIGHSEGGLVALAAAQRQQELCGLVLVATPGRRLGEIVRGQLRANPANAPLLAQASEVLSALEAGTTYDARKLDPALVPLFHGGVQKFLISVLALDPAALASAYRGPILIVQGQRDIQISEEDARGLRTARPDAELLLVRAMNHVLKDVDSEDRAANLAAYSDPARPISAELPAGIARFIGAHSR
jgi:pimeloyl-ACP methyl ester carboxylesterase